MQKHFVPAEISKRFLLVGGTQRFQGEMLEILLNGHCSTWGERGGRARLVFPFSDANSALNAPAMTQAGGMLGILLFSANPCGNQDLLAASGVV